MNRPWMKFYPADWRSDPRLRMCSLAARGLWIDLVCYMHEGEPYGYLTINGARPKLDQIASLVGRPVREVEKAFGELVSFGVLSCENGSIFSRRMVRDNARSEQDKKNGYDGGSPLIVRGNVPKYQRARGYRQSDSPAKTRRIFDRNDGKCHWCNVPLVRDWDGQGDLPLNIFHIDHVIAIRDGGDNDESNLVASCRACNGKRPDHNGRKASAVMVGSNSDPKAQSLEARSQIDEREIAHARASASPSLTEETIQIANAICAHFGMAWESLPPEWCGFAYKVQAWRNIGADRNFIMAKALSCGNRDGPPHPNYIDAAVRREWQRQSKIVELGNVASANRNPPAQSSLTGADAVLAGVGRYAARRDAENRAAQRQDGPICGDRHAPGRNDAA